MGSMTYYVVQPVLQAKKGGRVVPGEPVQAPSAAAAAAKVRSVEAGRIKGAVGAVAFSRTGDPTTGEWSDMVLIAKAGVVPQEMLEPAEL
jgi:hypothetical protein